MEASEPLAHRARVADGSLRADRLQLSAASNEWATLLRQSSRVEANLTFAPFVGAARLLR